MNRKELKNQIEGLLANDNPKLTREEKNFARAKNLIMDCDVPFVVISTDTPEDIAMKEGIADKLKRKIIYIELINDRDQVRHDDTEPIKNIEGL